MNAPATGADDGARIRPMTHADIPAVCRVGERAFPDAWIASDYEGELGQPTSRSWVLVAAGDIVAYLVAWRVMDELQILHIAVDPRAQRRGLGRRLLAGVLDEQRRDGMVLATLEVRASNVPAIGLYSSAGFVQVGRRKGYYRNNGEDALLMNLGPESGPEGT